MDSTKNTRGTANPAQTTPGKTQGNTQRTPLSSLGEFALIDRLAGFFPTPSPHTVLGPGDDCAMLAPPEGKQLLLSTDILLEGVHFDLTYFPLAHLGYKAVAVNLSDVAAMNAQPAHITVSIGIPKRMGVEDVEEIYRGIEAACSHYSVDIVGGDTSASITGLCISVTVIGYSAPETIAKRSGAKPNQLLCVTGNLGAPYLGLRILEREAKVLRANPEASLALKEYSYIIGRTLMPKPRLDAIDMLAKAGIVPSSMIDISDGLSSEILHIAKASGVGCRLYAERIPIDQETMKAAEELNLNPITVALHGGEDFELLFTVPLELQERMDDLGVPIIGYITPAAQGCVMVTPQGQEIPLTAQGWNAFPTEA